LFEERIGGKEAPRQGENKMSLKKALMFGTLLAYQGKDIVVFRFIIEYSSLKDFGP
jgi:hypothetical protein